LRRRHDLLPEALAAVAGWPVFVVDDSPAGLLEGLLPAGVHLVRGPVGAGFAAACNRGLAAAEAAGFSRVLLLNDDARPAPGCVEALLQALEATPRAAAAGPVLIDPTGRVESAGLRLGRHSGRVRQLRRVPAATAEVDALSGACLLLVAGWRLDEAYTFGFEDLELGRRMRAAGRTLLLVPGARCAHMGGGTVPRRSREAARHALAGHLRLVGERPWRRGIALALAVAQILRERGPMDRLLGLRDGWRDARRGPSTSGCCGGKFVS